MTSRWRLRRRQFWNVLHTSAADNCEVGARPANGWLVVAEFWAAHARKVAPNYARDTLGPTLDKQLRHAAVSRGAKGLPALLRPEAAEQAAELEQAAEAKVDALSERASTSATPKESPLRQKAAAWLASGAAQLEATRRNATAAIAIQANTPAKLPGPSGSSAVTT
eukprot:SAG11_NODE_8364_length_1024_cov_1.232432_2_plen_165_part_01